MNITDIILFLCLCIITFTTGSIIEQNHFLRLAKKEKNAVKLKLINHEYDGDPDKIHHVKIVSGSVVLAADFFKYVLYSIRYFFGGRVGSLETLMDRARREAIIRLKEKAKDADMVVNLRLETMNVAPRQVEAFAVGTAIYFKNS